MDEKKRAIVLAIVAAILLIVAILLNVGASDVSESKPAVREGTKTATGTGVVGLVISRPGNIEDRGNLPSGGQA